MLECASPFSLVYIEPDAIFPNVRALDRICGKRNRRQMSVVTRALWIIERHLDRDHGFADFWRTMGSRVRVIRTSNGYWFRIVEGRRPRRRLLLNPILRLKSAQ